MQLKSQEMRKLAPELDPLRIGTGWTKEDLGKVQVMVESTYGDSHLIRKAAIRGSNSRGNTFPRINIEAFHIVMDEFG